MRQSSRVCHAETNFDHCVGLYGDGDCDFAVRVAVMLTYFILQRVSEIPVPMIWSVMSDWLNGYSYRIALSPWIFVAAGLFCFVISFVTVFSQSYRAANASPVENIKTK